MVSGFYFFFLKQFVGICMRCTILRASREEKAFLMACIDCDISTILCVCVAFNNVVAFYRCHCYDAKLCDVIASR